MIRGLINTESDAKATLSTASHQGYSIERIRELAQEMKAGFVSDDEISDYLVQIDPTDLN